MVVLARKATTTPAIAPIVPEDVEGVSPPEGSQSAKERLLSLLQQKYHLSRTDAERYLKGFLARREREDQPTMNHRSE